MEIVTLENDHLKILIAPRYGAKIIEMWDKKANYQWLWVDGSREIRDRKFGDAFDAHDISGFDECFPNIGVSSYPLDEDKALPDHGDLWTQPCSWTATEEACVTTIKGKSFNYTFKRSLRLIKNSVKFEYEIVNKGPLDFYAFWSAHPLLKAFDGMKIEIHGNPKMTKEFGFSQRLGADGEDGYEGHLDPYVWPYSTSADGSSHDLSLIDTSKAITDKVVLRSPMDGVVKLLNPHIGCSLKFEFNPLDVPFVGICYNLNAWPFVGEKGCWLAIEPTQGATDRLDEAMQMGAALKFMMNKKVNFELCLTLEQI